MPPTELRFAALKETGIVGVLETPSAEQNALAEDRYAGLHAQLVTDGIARWSLTENIPAAVEQAMIWALAFLCAKPLGAPDEEVQRLAVLGAYGVTPMTMAERSIRKYAATRYVSQPATAEYF